MKTPTGTPWPGWRWSPATLGRALYERRGWTDGGLFQHQAPSDEGPIVVPSHRYEKHLA